jgi:tetratricopeptide (TPR) repeat protein
MLAIVYAVLAALVVGALTAFIPFIGPWGAILPALVAGGGLYFFLVRRINALLQKEMQGLQALLMNKNIDAALALLEVLKQRFSKWVPLLSSQLDGQIGSILYLKKDFAAARPYLERAFIRMWDAKLMLACLLSGEVTSGKKGEAKPKADLKAVDELLNRVARYAPKQGLLYSTWAWLHWRAGDVKRALEILARGKDVLGESDPHLTANILALQNDKKMKMKGYGEIWYTLHLEQHPVVMQQQRGGNVRFARR